MGDETVAFVSLIPTTVRGWGHHLGEENREPEKMSAQGHTVGQGQPWDLKIGLTSESRFLPLHYKGRVAGVGPPFQAQSGPCHWCFFFSAGHSS